MSAERLGQLLTATSTTGWLDWIHGELWLFPDGLLRIRLGLLKTVAHGFWPSVSRKHPLLRTFDAAMFATLAARRGNLWIARQQIVSAWLAQGVMAHELHLTLVDGRTITLLWAPVDPALAPLRAVMTEWLS